MWMHWLAMRCWCFVNGWLLISTRQAFRRAPPPFFMNFPNCCCSYSFFFFCKFRFAPMYCHGVICLPPWFWFYLLANLTWMRHGYMNHHLVGMGCMTPHLTPSIIGRVGLAQNTKEVIPYKFIISSDVWHLRGKEIYLFRACVCVGFLFTIKIKGNFTLLRNDLGCNETLCHAKMHHCLPGCSAAHATFQNSHPSYGMARHDKPTNQRKAATATASFRKRI